MSNLSQFVGKSFPIGGTVTMPYMGSFYTAPDGTQWMSLITTAPFAYTSDYSYLSDEFKTPHTYLSGPEPNGFWTAPASPSYFSIAYRPTTTLYVTASYVYDGTSYYYYTSTDGTNWTKRTFPNNINYSIIQFVSGKFVAVATSTTTNGIITSTDGITWTSVTGVSIANITDIISNNGNNIVIYPYVSTTGAYSTDGGSTWASTTFSSTSSGSTYSMVGKGAITWNAGAGLFIAASSTSGAYQTSPTGATWTHRTSQATYLPYSGYFGNQSKFASSATTTVCVGSYGFFATTTDGLTWSNHGFIDPNLMSSMNPYEVWYDGTRFCVRFASIIYYSTNGTTWTKGKYLGTTYSTIGNVSGNTAFLPTYTWGATPMKVWKISDVTATTPQYVSISTGGGTVFSGATLVYYRIK